MVSKAAFAKIALSFETAEMALHFNQPSIKVFGKFFTRLRAEDDTIVLTVPSREERDMLLELDPETFTLTDHYRNGPWILARRDKIDTKRLTMMLERRWLKMAPKHFLKERAQASADTTKAVPSPKPRTAAAKTRKHT